MIGSARLTRLCSACHNIIDRDDERLRAPRYGLPNTCCPSARSDFYYMTTLPSRRADLQVFDRSSATQQTPDGYRWLTSLIHAALLVLLVAGHAFAQANGRLQIHYMDVGQGDGMILISPQGETVLIDDGVLNQCGKPLAYLQSL